jgi:allantoinase
VARRQAHRGRRHRHAGDLERGQGTALLGAGEPGEGGRDRSRRHRWGSYGGKVGVYRLINLFRENGIRGTFCVNGRCAELYPEAVGEIVKSGHDAAGHGWYQDQLMSYMPPDEERDTIRRSLDVLEKATGKRPVGWLGPSMAFSENTRRFLVEEGLKWHGDARDSDLPRIVDTPSGTIVHIPGSDFIDNRVLRSSSMDLWDVHKTTSTTARRRPSWCSRCTATSAAAR